LEAVYHKREEVIENAEGFFAKKGLEMFKSPKSIEKQAIKLQRSIDKLESGNFSGINFLVLPGLSLIEKRNLTADNKFFQNMIALFSDLKGREFAVDNARYLLASMYSAALGGIGFTLISGVLMFLLQDDSTMGLLIALLGPMASLVIAYALFNSLKSKAKARRDEIMFDFAQATTEIALLTSSGMEMFQAWDEVCKKPERTGALYREMRQVSADIEYGAQPGIALEAFIKRCGTKDTSRLGASILQNLTRGNEELSLFLTELSREVWEERKHSARQLGEKASSKLMLPMGMIFLGILIMVGTAVVIGMGAMGI
jgi:tight adherence protein C